MHRKLVAAAVSGVIALAVTGAASAAVTELHFTAPGAQPQVYFTGFVPGTTDVDPALSAEFTVTLNSITNGGYGWNFSYTLANTSTTASRLATIGWDVDPDIVSAGGVTGVFGNWAEDGNLASLGSVEFCLKNTPGASCSGGGNGGLVSGASGAGTFSLAFASQSISYTYVQQPVYNPKGKLVRYETVAVPHVTTIAAPTMVTFSDFGLHLQALADGRSTVAVPGDRPQITAGVPEPAAWAIMILGFGGVGATMRRRRRRLSSAGLACS